MRRQTGSWSQQQQEDGGVGGGGQQEEGGEGGGGRPEPEGVHQQPARSRTDEVAKVEREGPQAWVGGEKRVEGFLFGIFSNP